MTICASAQSPIQNALSRFTDPEKGHTVFIEKGHYALGSPAVIAASPRRETAPETAIPSFLS